jgi:tRNA (guanine37-N1)-methyltransferase
MRVDIITVLPQLLDSFFADSIMQRAQNKKLAEIVVHNLRDYSTDKYKSVDDYQYGGGAGMVIMLEPVVKILNKLKSERKYDEIIYTTPDGEQFNQKTANKLSVMQNVIILCGHYKGVDERIREHFITKEISIGDFVLSGGELPAAVITDAVIRLIPGVLNDGSSALTDSFQDDLLAPPVYTRPADYNGWKVPDILLSGHEKQIEEWRHTKALERTKLKRPDLYNKLSE